MADDDENWSDDDTEQEKPSSSHSHEINKDQLIVQLQEQVVDLQSKLSEMASAAISIIGSDEREDARAKQAVKEELLKSHLTRHDRAYFESYDRFSIHREMLHDKVRTKSYMDAILQNPQLFANKYVLDVGCGTGILSMFAAKAGAKHVIGADMSDILNAARKIIDHNGLSSAISLVRGKIEEVDLPSNLPDGKVDIIISEWMGYFLFYESMLESVIVARDKFLRPGGVVLPDKCSLSIVGAELTDEWERWIAPWNNEWGFDYSVLNELAEQQDIPDDDRPKRSAGSSGPQDALQDPLVDIISASRLMTNSCEFFAVDCNTVKSEELDFYSCFKVEATRDAKCHALVCYFDIGFVRGCDQNPVYFSTSPSHTPTHWKQTILFLRKPLDMHVGDVVMGTLRATRNKDNNRHYDIDLTHQHVPKNGEAQPSESVSGSYYLW
eukprot:TRINITY_DN2149_c0_g1::TRINITY_DN2149_c0_g1_i1::g.12877::m.12877 TRINITY_DN2149_c0_g1::TRINITY_DN2149_c0_g1_i1::g.12877  ORF type:complete len:514 (+),score=139.54,sp/Q54EF2/ANM1_DICDI/46.22/2e-93,Methyltransf_31/PF13847.1/2.3e-11,PrmA/PF06325.8/1.8e+03,PrmA/PF06325.8/3.8e-10,Methyltransf_18/PF12847.2/1.2e-09,Methyltransf_26/PF13659.1/8.8e-09,Methyltransf_11/PF08241.7/1.5e-08,MTS/PF05175.9/3.1e-07,Methyltransf_23/PF13489.1/5.7e-07,PRMT5/PF05185.11/2.7e-06,Methyltransf_12/PF08242.7/0.00014,Methylt